MKTFFSILAIITLIVMMIGAAIYLVTGNFYQPLGITPLFFIIFTVASKSKKFQN